MRLSSRLPSIWTTKRSSPFADSLNSLYKKTFLKCTTTFWASHRIAGPSTAMSARRCLRQAGHRPERRRRVLRRRGSRLRESRSLYRLLTTRSASPKTTREASVPVLRRGAPPAPAASRPARSLDRIRRSADSGRSPRPAPPSGPQAPPAPSHTWHTRR